MKIGILITGAPPSPLLDRYGGYGEMFRALLGADYDYADYEVTHGQLPAPEDCDAYLVTGSNAGVYEPHPWIPPLKAFLVAAKGRAAIVGICFGHQILAEAFGGKVEKAAVGWGVGLHRYDLLEIEPWMDGSAAPLRIPAMHQDQIVRMPLHARTLARSDFTPHAVVLYDDQPVLSFQGHPEFAPDFAADLIARRRGKALEPAFADAAIESLSHPNDGRRVATWIRNFLDAHAQAKGAGVPSA